jgi:hypothetical protein
MVYTLRFLNSKCSLFHNSNLFGSCIIHILFTGCAQINSMTPTKLYSGRTAPLTSKVAFCIFIQQIDVPNILNMVYTLCFFLFKMKFV